MYNLSVKTKKQPLHAAGERLKMKTKQLLKIILSLVLVAAAFTVSYTVTLSVERKKYAGTAFRSVQSEAAVTAVGAAAENGENAAGEAAANETSANGTAETADGAAAAQTTENTAESSLPTAAETDDKLPEPTIVNMPSDDTWCYVLLNKYYKMNDTYEPHLDECIEGTSVYLDKNVAEKFIEMYNAALEDGVTLTPVSGYVSPDRQKRAFDKQTEQFVSEGYTEEKAESLASFTVLPVGCSEHNYGLAIDIGVCSAEFAETPAYTWLKAHAAEYGFIERYTAEKESVTHFNAAPWHWRYVGAAAAKEMNSKGVCLEEYVGFVN